MTTLPERSGIMLVPCQLCNTPLFELTIKENQAIIIVKSKHHHGERHKSLIRIEDLIAKLKADSSLTVPAHRRPDFWLVHDVVWEKANFDEIFCWVQQELAQLDIHIQQLEYPAEAEVTLNLQYMTLTDALNTLAAVAGCCWMIVDGGLVFVQGKESPDDPSKH